MSGMISAVPEDAPALSSGFLLIEPATLLYVPELNTCPMHACVPRELTHREELMPRLIDVAALTEGQQRIVSECWDEEIATARPPVACAWIDCDEDIDSLRAHIGEQLVGPGGKGSPVFWRFYDPRVMGMIAVILDSGQILALLGPAKTWRFAWAGYRWELAGAGLSIAHALETKPAWPRPDQWIRLDRSNIAALVSNRLPPVSAAAAQYLAGELDRIFCEVVSRGVTLDDDNLADYALHCFRYGPAFEQHPVLVEAWPSLARSETAWPEVKLRIMNSEIPFAGQANRAAKSERIEA